MRLSSFLLSVPLLLIGCSASQDMKIAEGEIVPFHERLDSGKFEEIYEASAQDLKKVADKQEFILFLAAVHRKLGAVKSVTPRGSNINMNTFGTFVQLQYETTFDEGKALELFNFRVDGAKALLAGYQINSMALITK